MISHPLQLELLSNRLQSINTEENFKFPGNFMKGVMAQNSPQQ